MYHMVQNVEVSVTSAAPPEAIYQLLVDVTSWTAWSGMAGAELEKPGEDDPLGVGSVRALSRGRFRGLDTVVELVPGKRFAYTHVGLPVRDYRAVVDLEPVAGGTRITWHSTFQPRYPGTGWIWRLGIRRMLTQTATGLAEHAA